RLRDFFLEYDPGFINTFFEEFALKPQLLAMQPNLSVRDRVKYVKSLKKLSTQEQKAAKMIQEIKERNDGSLID
ncbi:MAG: hypothetical protein WCD44_01780, partial [Candidatus Babeliales bacterium]